MSDSLSPSQRYAASRERAKAPRVQEFADGLEFALDEFQVEACRALESGLGVLVAAPTGAGKTVVGEFAVHLGLASGRKTFYTTPIKALSNQKYSDLVQSHGSDQVGLLTGDTSINGEASVVVMTTEVLRNMIYAGSDLLDGLGYVVMDEVHYLADRSRGAVWEEVIIHLDPSVIVVSLSATVSNAEEFGDWLSAVRGETAVVVSERRPVPLGQYVLLGSRLRELYAGSVDPTEPGSNPRINPDLVAALHKAEVPGRHGRVHRIRPTGTVDMVQTLDHANMLPAIVFIFSRAGCQSAVDRCLHSDLRLTSIHERERIREVIAKRLDVIDPGDLVALEVDRFTDALLRGVAAHHAGLLPLFKETVEELFAAGLVKVVFATETLALGINMPARSVVLDQLVKWDGQAMTDLTAGEYTQLTGRAGRRGIDTVGHAVVVARQGFDPVQVARLASRRLYPLRSSFAPTYNMAVNLVARMGRERAREILESSFAQYQADRAVVGLARRLQATTRNLEDITNSMSCSHGDAIGYDDLRRELTDAEKADRRPSRRDRVEVLARLRPGDVVRLSGRRRGHHAVVVDTAAGLQGASVTVVDGDGRHRQLNADDPTVEPAGHMDLAPGFNARSAASRKQVGATVRKWRSAPPTAPLQERIVELRKALRAHPCHRCPDRAEHIRLGAQRARLVAEKSELTDRIAGRAGTVAARFDAVCGVLIDLEYVALRPDGELALSPSGTRLRQISTESDLLTTQCLRDGHFSGLDAAQLGAAVAALIYRSRRDEQSAPKLPGGPLGAALIGIQDSARIVTEAEQTHGLTTQVPPDLGLVDAVYQWGRGRSLGTALHRCGLEAGDFVRWVKQVIDLLGQIAKATDDMELRRTARAAIGALRRGVVAFGTTEAG